MLDPRTIVALLVAATVLVLPISADAQLKKLRIGYPSHSASMYPIYVTKEARLLEKYGLDGELIYVQGVQMVRCTWPANWMSRPHLVW